MWHWPEREGGAFASGGSILLTPAVPNIHFASRDGLSRPRPARLQHIAGIGVDRMSALADASGQVVRRLENLDAEIPPDEAAVARTREATSLETDNSHLPFVGQACLREAVARRLLQQRTCATTMDGWGETQGPQYIRLVFSNEPVARLEGLSKRVRSAYSVVPLHRGEAPP